MRVYFIVHGNSKIGMGHVMRSLSLAEAFRERGHSVSFFSKYNLGIGIIRKRGFEVHCIPGYIEAEETEEKGTEGFFYGTRQEAIYEAEYISAQIKESADILIVDSYNVNKEFFSILKRKAKCLIYIDDLNAFSYQVDVLINGSSAAHNMGYEKIQTAQLLLGLQYNLIRREFKNLPLRDVKAEVENVLITTGNSDPCHMTEKILKIFKEEKAFQKFKLHVIIGSGFDADGSMDFDALNELSVFLYHKPENICEIMLKCDLAITAGGSTIYELAACGVPCIVFAYADNQIPQIIEMEKEELLQYIGRYQSINKAMLIRHIQYMQEQYQLRKNLIKKLQTLVDGRGASRIVEEIEKMQT